MDIEIDAFLPSDQELLKKLGLDENGSVQKVVDTSFIHYMRLNMPMYEGMMIQSVRNPKGGLVTVNTPYAHYQNEGILYVMPENGKGAFHDPISGMFWSKRGEAKVSSGKPLNYHGGTNRGAHFVERTGTEYFDKILKEAQKELDKK